MGEDLKVGANLTWGPCFDYQKQFFTGAEDKESRFPFLLRYDVEVSGFPSSHCGHICLLRLKQQDYPDLAKLWDCSEKSPSMILFKDGKPVATKVGSMPKSAIVEWLNSVVAA